MAPQSDNKEVGRTPRSAAPLPGCRALTPATTPPLHWRGGVLAGVRARMRRLRRRENCDSSVKNNGAKPVSRPPEPRLSSCQGHPYTYQNISGAFRRPRTPNSLSVRIVPSGQGPPFFGLHAEKSFASTQSTGCCLAPPRPTLDSAGVGLRKSLIRSGRNFLSQGVTRYDLQRSRPDGRHGRHD